MSKKMLINASHPEENRVAIVVDGILSELDIELAGQEQSKGNIYKAVVVRVETGLQAAFVDYGAEKLGFLQIGEIHPNIYPPKEESRGRPRINDILHRGQEILVQVVKEERGNKGAALTTFLSIPGRYMVLMPDSTTKGVSRKISDDSERKKLKKTMAELDLPERMGYIVRTAGIGKAKEELKRDFDYLVRLFEGIVARQDQVKAPAQLYRESNLVIRSIRDYFSTEMDEVLIDDPKVFKEAKDFFALVMPEFLKLVKQHRERRPIFSRYQIEEQIDALSRNQISMVSGGSIVIDQTEALVAIDVNSGKMSSESGIEATATKTNLEAAAEVGRQLRLRDLGGLVVIDFIDMRDRKNIREVEQELRKALKDDKAKVTVGRISQFGLMEMSRQRLKPTLSVGAYLECPHCHGIGRIKSAEAQAVALLRQIHAAASKGQIGQIDVSVPVSVANDLHNSKRQTLVDLEKRFNLQVKITGRADMLPDELELELHKRETSEEKSREILPVSHANQIEFALAAQKEESEQQPASEPEAEAREADGVAAGSETELETDSEKKGRKRRRKRRKKPLSSDDNVPGSETELESVPGQQSAETSTAAAPTASASEKPEMPSEDGPAAEDKPKRRRSRRSPAKKTTPTTEAETTAAATPQTVEPATVATDNPAVQSEASTPAADKPKRRRSRRSPAKKTATVTEPEAAAATTTQAAEPTSVATDKPAVKPETSTTTAEKPKRRRSRRSPAKKTAAETDSVAVPAEPQQDQSTAAAEKNPPGKVKTPPATDRAATVPDTATPEAAVADKPKRRPRRSSKKPGTALTAENQPATATELPSSIAATAEKDQPAPKKPQRRTRRSTPKTVTEQAPAAQAEATEAAAQPESTAKPRTRRPAKKTTPATKDKLAAPATATTAEKPKRRPGRPRKTTPKPPEQSES